MELRLIEKGPKESTLALRGQSVPLRSKGRLGLGSSSLARILERVSEAPECEKIHGPGEGL